MRHLRGLVLLPLFLSGGARRRIRIDDTYHGAQQQNNALANGLAVSAVSQETLIPGGFGTGLFRHVGLGAGALREESMQDGRRAGHPEPYRGAPLILSGPRRSKVTLQAGSGPEGDSELITRLRAEIESPFAKVRLFVLPALFAAAAIATYFGGTSLLAEAANLRPASDDSLQNFVIDVAALGIIGALWRREVVSNEKRMKRIRAGAALSSLRVQPLGGERAGKSVRLADLRSGRGSDDPFDQASRRVIIVVAEEAVLGACLDTARPRSAELAEADFLVVPVLLCDGRIDIPPLSLVVPTPPEAGSSEQPPTEHLALPEGVGRWRDVLGEELETAVGQDAKARARGFTLILKKNGRVGTRRLGMPDWSALVGDVTARAGAGLDTRNI